MSAERHFEQDIFSEKDFAELIGTTERALQARRYRQQIPEGVWNKKGRETLYSKRRYYEWLENQWICPPGWNSSASRFESVSREKEGAAVKRSPFPSRRKGSRLPPSLEIR